VSGVPELSRFYGISIRMHVQDHPPPHVHAWYSGRSATVPIEHPRISAGFLPARVTHLVIRWVELHRTRLLAAWSARGRLPLPRLPPLE